MQHRVLTIALISTAIALPLSPLAAKAQSFPAGQVSHRMAARSTASDNSVRARTEDFKAKLAVAKAPATVVAAPVSQQTDAQIQQASLGVARQTAWGIVVKIGSDVPVASDNAMTAARQVANAITDDMSLDDAKKFALAAKLLADAQYGQLATDKVQDATKAIIDNLNSLRCGYNTGSATATKANPQYQYQFRTWLPTVGPGCTDVAILGFFSATHATDLASNVKYLYNAQQSTSQVNADLLTATFAPGFQAVLAGTATSGSSKAASSTASGGVRRADTGDTGSSTTDSVATAVAKIQAGGDFNIRFPAPVLYHQGTHYSLSGMTSPNLGFNINGFSGQNTITEATEYSFNVPFEFYMQTASIDTGSSGLPAAVLFLDLRPSAEVISAKLAQAIQLTGARGFFLGQASAGIEFSQSVRVSFQYIYGPEQIYQTTTTSGTPTSAKSRIGEFHLAISFSPQKSKT